MSDHALVVVQPFADFAKGDRITDQKKIDEVLESHANRVVRVPLQEAPAEEQH